MKEEEGKKEKQEKNPLKGCKVLYFVWIHLEDQEHNSFLLKQPYVTKQVYL